MRILQISIKHFAMMGNIITENNIAITMGSRIGNSMHYTCIPILMLTFTCNRAMQILKLLFDFNLYMNLNVSVIIIL